MSRGNKPAFPYVVRNDRLAEAHRGLTIRDYFAAQAMIGLMGQIDVSDSGFELGLAEPPKLAEHAYRIADAMVLESEKNQ